MLKEMRLSGLIYYPTASRSTCGRLPTAGQESVRMAPGAAADRGTSVPSRTRCPAVRPSSDNNPGREETDPAITLPLAASRCRPRPRSDSYAGFERSSQDLTLRELR